VRDSFKSIAHSRAARTIDALPTAVETLADDKKKAHRARRHRGQDCDKIIEFVKTGRITEHDQLRAKVPPGSSK